METKRPVLLAGSRRGKSVGAVLRGQPKPAVVWLDELVEQRSRHPEPALLHYAIQLALKAPSGGS